MHVPRESTKKSPRSFKYPVFDGEREAIIDAYNRRIKLYGMSPLDLQDVKMNSLLEVEPALKDIEYSKIIVYSVEGDDEDWELSGFTKEGIISGFFPKHIDAHIWTAFTENARRATPYTGKYDRIVETALRKKSQIPAPPEGYSCEVAKTDHAEDISALLSVTFQDYPIPIDLESIEKRVDQRDHYFRIMRDVNGELAAVASAEIDFGRESAEFTDCATGNGHRGKGLMTFLLWQIEQDLISTYGISDLYSLVRAMEVDVNCIFGKLGYQYSGRLINNCRMPEGWESLNIWCKTAREGSIGDRVDKLSFSARP